MSSTYSTDLRIELIGTGDQAGVWGVTTNSNLNYVIEQAIAGYISVSVSAVNQALTYINGGSSTPGLNQSVYAAIALTTSTATNFAVYAPPVSKLYVIYNASSFTATIYNSTVIGNTTAAGTGVAIPAGKTMTVWSDGTNFTQQNTHLISPTLASPTMTTPVLGTPASGTLTNTTGFPVANLAGAGTGVLSALAVNVGSAGAPVLFNGALGTPSSGTLTNATGLPISTGVSGLGSGIAAFLATPSSANLASAVTDETGSGALVFANSPTLVTPALGTPSSGNLANCTFPTLNQNTTGNAATATKFSSTGGSAPAYAARAWANYVGSGSPSINASQNVSSIGWVQNGIFTINFGTSMPDANFSATGSSSLNTTGTADPRSSAISFFRDYSTTSVNQNVYSITSADGAWGNANVVNVTIHR